MHTYTCTPIHAHLYMRTYTCRYVLLRGRKRFRLFSPADAHRMYTYGRICRVHPNGRINYQGEISTTPDGRTHVDCTAEALRLARKAQRRAERRLAEAEDAATAEDAAKVAVVSAAATASAAVEDAENELDVAMDAAVRAAVIHERACRKASAQRSMAPSAADNPEARAAPPSFSRITDLTAQLRMRSQARRARDNGQDRGGGRQGDGQGGSGAGGGESHPLLEGASLSSFTLEAGQMLYMPAGWFHEVSSSGSHCAINYWFHPPPYSATAKSFWEREWERAVKQHATR